MISIVIPVKNGATRLGRLLDAIDAQKMTEDVEIVVVDSGSTDGTPELARARGAQVHEIAAAEFNHGGTRNLGFELSRGEFVVFTVDDAVPVGTGWLESLVAPLRDDVSLAGSYSRQIATPGAPPGQRLYLEYRYGPEPRVQAASKAEELTIAATRFSNVSAAFPRDVLAEQPFRDDLITAEDLEWCGRVLLAGYRVAYAPDSVIAHSHSFTAKTWFQRYFDQGVAARLTVLRAGSQARTAVRGEGLRYVRWEMAALRRSGNGGDIPRTLLFEATRYVAFQAGSHHGAIPKRLRPRLSYTPTFWARS